MVKIGEDWTSYFQINESGKDFREIHMEFCFDNIRFKEQMKVY